MKTIAKRRFSLISFCCYFFFSSWCYLYNYFSYSLLSHSNFSLTFIFSLYGFKTFVFTLYFTLDFFVFVYNVGSVGYFYLIITLFLHLICFSFLIFTFPLWDARDWMWHFNHLECSHFELHSQYIWVVLHLAPNMICLLNLGRIVTVWMIRVLRWYPFLNQT